MANFQSVLNYAKNLEDTTEKTQASLRKIRGARTRLINQINKGTEQIKYASNETKYVADLKENLRKEAVKSAKDILNAKVLEAVRENYEFDSSTYMRGLLEALRKSETYRVDIRGAGWKSTIKVDINLNRTAGRLQSWGQGVKLARKSFGSKVPKKGSKRREKSALQASKAWARIFENRGETAIWKRTINLRKNYSGSLAAWWQLLDKGEVPLSSDRGGYPTPAKRATNFVHRSEKDSEEYMKKVMTQQKNKYDNLFTEYDNFVIEANEMIAILNRLIGDIKINLDAVRKVERALGPIAQYIDSNKLEKVVQKIREGLLVKGKVELTALGSQKRIRPSVKTISEFLYK